MTSELQIQLNVAKERISMLEDQLTATDAASRIFERQSEELARVFEVLYAAGKIPEGKPGPGLDRVVQKLIAELTEDDEEIRELRMRVYADHPAEVEQLRAQLHVYDALAGDGDRITGEKLRAEIKKLNDKVAALEERCTQLDCYSATLIEANNRVRNERDRARLDIIDKAAEIVTLRSMLTDTDH